MARRPDIQYVRYYTDGSAARKIETALPEKRKTALPKVRRKKQQVIYVDPLAIGGIVVSAVMLVLMVIGSVQLYTANNEALQMESYVASLQEQNRLLAETYEAGIDLEAVEKSALALGMIPVEQAQQYTIHVTVPETVEEPPTAWERFTAFFQGLFA